MTRGKIQIKRIENQTNRQVTYSKRRNGLFKKAHELTVLCDAKVSIVMVSNTQKLHEYISPTTTTKQVFDQYQKAVGVDIWSRQHEKMQAQLQKLKEVNRNLRKEIRQRMGECLNDLGYEQMINLIEDIDSSLGLIREKKYKTISNRIETSKKKVRNVEEIHRNLVLECDAIQEDPHYGLVENEADYNSVLGFSNEGPRIFSLGLPLNAMESGGSASDLTTFALLG
ncbi:DEFICIENS-like MADS-box protein [Striga asiatica]|uniref:DEFICIENS-like MADS-box protein n=1 Tax=Striga asiatica TaxID=4170 RepID=A0A5A7PRC5_STRAF|nr:DEFICIENS-like MADS-box protein [Striga asiatica]